MKRRTEFCWQEVGIACMFVAWFVVLFRNFNVRAMWSFGDLLPFPVTYKQGIDAFLTNWQPQSLGNAIPRTPLLVVFGALQLLLGNNGSLAQKVLYLSLLPVGSAFMYWFLGQLTSSRVARVVGTFVFTANPVINGEFVGGAVGLLFSYALLPLVIRWTLIVARRPRDFASWIGLSLLVLLDGWITPHVMPLLSVTMLLTWCFARIGDSERISLRDLVPRVAFLGAAAALLYAWFFYESPLVGAVASLPVESLIGEVRINYSTNNAESILRLAYWSFLLQPLGYAYSTPLTALGFSLPILAFSAFLQRATPKPLYVAFSALSLGIVAFIWLAHVGLLNGIFATFPLLFIYRGPTMPLYFLVFSYAVQATISTSVLTPRSDSEFRLFRYLRTRIASLSKTTGRSPVPGKRTVIMLVALAMLASSLYITPMLDGTMGLRETRGSNYTVNAELQNIASWVQTRRQSEGFFRTLWVPLTYEDYNALVWLDPYIFGAPLGASVYGYPSLQFITNTLDILCSNSTTSIGVLLREASVKYVILNLGSSASGPCSQSGGLPYGSPDAYRNLLNSQADLKEIEVQPTFIAFLNLDFRLRVTVSGSPLLVLNMPETSVAPASQELPPNLLTNPEFAQNGSGWNKWLPQFISFEEVEGTSSMTAALTRPAHSDIPQTWVPEMWELLPARSGSWYRLSFEARSVNALNISVRITWFSSPGRMNPLGVVSVLVPSGSMTDIERWSNVGTTVQAPGGSSYLSVEFQGGFNFDASKASVVWYRRPAIHRVFTAGQPPATDEGIALLASELPLSKTNRPPLLIVHTAEELEAAMAATGSVGPIVYVNNPWQRSNLATLTGSSIARATFMSSAIGILQVQTGNWSQTNDPLYSANVMAGASGNASGFLNLTGLDLRASTIWIRGAFIGTLTFFAPNAKSINGSTMVFGWFPLEVNSPVSSVPFQFKGLDLWLEAFVIQPINGSAFWPARGSLPLEESNEFGSDFTIHVRGAGPATVILSDSYDSGWRAEVGAAPMTHLRSAFGFNVFTLNSVPGNATIHIFYASQSTRNVILFVTVAFIAVGISWIVLSQRARLFRIFGSSHHSNSRRR